MGFAGRLFEKCPFGRDWKHLKNVDGKLLLSLGCSTAIHALLKYTPPSLPIPQSDRRPLILFLKGKFLDTRPVTLFLNVIILVLGLFIECWWVITASCVASNGFPLRAPSAVASQACPWHMLVREIWSRPSGPSLYSCLQFHSNCGTCFHLPVGAGSRKCLKGLQAGWCWSHQNVSYFKKESL